MMENAVARMQGPPNADPRQSELIDLVARFAPGEGLHETPIGPLKLIRADEPRDWLCTVYEPGLCVVVQGRKQASLAGEVYRYDALNYLVVSVSLPAIGQVLEASPERPFLCVRLDIDPGQISGLLLEADLPPREEIAGGRGLRVSRVSDSILDAILRLVRLLASPKDTPVLAPLVMREIHYRVLTGELGPRLRELAVADSHTERIARAIDYIKRSFHEPLRIETLAAMVYMSPSSLHHHFKAVTAMSPLQFQKQLRLHEARRLLVSEGLDAMTAGHRVGYESPSQFSRDYRRLFGAPPRRETAELRNGR